MHTKPTPPQVCIAPGPQEEGALQPYPPQGTAASKALHLAPRATDLKEEAPFSRKIATRAIELRDFAYQPTAFWEPNLPQTLQACCDSLLEVRDNTSPSMPQV